MSPWRFPLLAASALLLTGFLAACEMKIGDDAPAVDANASAEGRAEEGRLTVEAPGFNLSLNIPEGIQSRAEIGENNDLVYPGATLGGIHVQGKGDQARNGGEVELRFHTGEPIDRVVAWYRDPARAKIKIDAIGREGAGVRIRGSRQAEGENFSLHLDPAGGGGTEGRLILSDAR